MNKQVKAILVQSKESLIYCFRSVAVHKFRTFLSLFGITIGIFSIITVFTVIDTMEHSIRKSMDAFGGNVIYLQKNEWAVIGPSEWWKFLNRPQISYREYEQLSKQLTTADQIAFAMEPWNGKVVYKNNYFGGYTLGVTSGYDQIYNIEIEQGRFISSFEHSSGAKVAVIGTNVAAELFDGESPIGKIVKVNNQKVSVVGVMKPVGISIGEDFDQTVILPSTFVRMLVDEKNASPYIIIRGKESVTAEAFKDDIIITMRKLRRLPPAKENNFGVNELSMFAQALDQVFATLNIAGGLIGMFSVLVGGFGIANIMFVSVRERMSEIGIQKALGAKSYYILLQFMYEAVLLSLMGGVLGLLLVYGVSLIVQATTEFELTLSLKNIILGLAISGGVGAISGFIPAHTASKMDPIKAIYKI